MARILVVDNYDSFTWNLVQLLETLGARVEVVRNDREPAAALGARRPDGVVLSPGPGTPDRAGATLDAVGVFAARGVPVLGVCLGHQAIGQAYGGRVVRAPVPMHGKLSQIHHTGQSVFRGLKDGFAATRYHSLVIERSSLPPSLSITAETDDGVIMGVAHKSQPVHGVQFHPESIASEHGHALLKNFLELARVKTDPAHA